MSSLIVMQVHRGTDGSMYILDVARMFPPEAPLDKEKLKKDPRYTFSALPVYLPSICLSCCPLCVCLCSALYGCICSTHSVCIVYSLSV